MPAVCRCTHRTAAESWTVAVTHSAGIVLLRTPPNDPDQLEILLVHPGGPFWAKKDQHGWSIPKGEFDPDEEDALVAARREFHEELGSVCPAGDATPIPAFRAGSKWIHSFVLETAEAAAFDADDITSNTFEMEWPPRSGQQQSFPEVDRAAWFDVETAAHKLHKGQLPLIAHVRQR